MSRHGGKSPDAAKDHKCGGKSEVFAGVPQSGEYSAAGSRCGDGPSVW